MAALLHSELFCKNEMLPTDENSDKRLKLSPKRKHVIKLIS